MYKNILVPLDGTKRAEAVLPHVEKLARQCGAAITLLEVLEPLPQHAAAVAPDVLRSGAAQRRKEITGYVHQLADSYRSKGFDTREVVVRGPVVETIVETAATVHADLIAMASHAHTGIARVIHGSVAAEVLHRSTAPLLLVRAGDE
ncbi:MAG: universal stress protein [Caldilineaceae bacterium]|nr:universal stress protein [Caldilineaceae bacterium]